ncbi:MFS transporter [Flexibacterium corallicola]|uniref:MFS transporter n=1 Tax=Flexibacterium corallicola TaxID=3037259 RepID=UPI00286F05EC|nr:MFS transporter [Pseudovibrio sp. M1P-2-3]
MAILSGFSTRYFLTMSVAMGIAALLSIAVTLTEFNSGLHPYLISKAESVTSSVKQNIEYATSIGIPFDKIRGLDTYLSELELENPEIERISLISASGLSKSNFSNAEVSSFAKTIPSSDSEQFWGRVKNTFGSLADIWSNITGAGEESMRVYADISVSGSTVAKLETVIDANYVDNKMANVFFDTLVIFIAVCLIAIEVVVVYLNASVTYPLRQIDSVLSMRARGNFNFYQGANQRGRIGRFIAVLNKQNDALRRRSTAALEGAGTAKSKIQAFIEKHALFAASPPKPARIIDARIPLFVFCFAEELQKSFMPLFVAEYYSPTDLFDRDIMMGLPISAFMFVIAAITPFAAGLIDRFGNKTLYLVGLVPAIGGYVYCALAQSGNDIVLARSLTAVGYGIITISCQSYIAAVATGENRARAMAAFVGVLMAATMCGTATGAIFADWLGYKPVFMIATVLSLVAGVMGWKMLHGNLPSSEPQKSKAKASSVNPFGALLRNPSFLLILLFCAIPAKIVLTGFLYFFVPIYLASLEASQSEIGRVMMLYSLIIIPISPLASRFSDQLGKNLWVVICATIISGIVLIGLYQSASVAAVLAVVAALGLAHAFLKAPLIVAAMDAAALSPDVSRTGALSFLRMFERIGSVAGPVVVGAMLVTFNYGDTAAILGAIIAGTGVLMAVLTLIVKRSTKREAGRIPV